MSKEFTCKGFVTFKISRLIGQDPANMSPAARAQLAPVSTDSYVHCVFFD